MLINTHKKYLTYEYYKNKTAKEKYNDYESEKKNC